MNIHQFPRIKLGHFPTPLEPLTNLSKFLGGPEIWIKRDDCTGLASGGNKTRKLEFLMAEAVAEGADMVLTQGATQSNHARQTAAAAAKCGMDCHIILEDRTHYNHHNYKENGNVLVDRLCGATIEHRGDGLDMNGELMQVAEDFKEKGRKTYAIPGGGSNATGALGYVNCILELSQQMMEMGLHFNHFVTATGSAGTQAGLAVGLQAMNMNLPLLGVGVRAPKPKQEENVYNLAKLTAEKIGMKTAINRDQIIANCDYVGEGYGIPHQSTLDAIKIFAKYEGILLDPVYSGKGAAGLIDLVRKGHFGTEGKILFLHTGGSLALAGYDFALEAVLN